MRTLAYARSTPTQSASDQIARAEEWSRRERHELHRLTNHILAPGAREYPPRAAVLDACRQGLVDAVVVTDLAALGPDLVETLESLDRCGVRLLVAGEYDLDSRSLQFAVAVGRAMNVASAERRDRRPQRPRVCPVRVQIDLDEVHRRRGRGETLLAISQALGVGRSCLVSRLKRERDARARARHDQNGQ